MAESFKATLKAVLRFERLLFRSRFGRRLLLLFLACALLPTLAVALLSFRSVRGQLSETSEEHLHSLASAAARTIYDRLELIETDLRALGPRISACRARAARHVRPPDCGAHLDYALETVGLVEGGAVVALFGEPDSLLLREAASTTGLAPGQSGVVTRSTPGRGVRLILVHRLGPGIAKAQYLAGELSSPYLWSAGDMDGFPRPVRVTIWDPVHGDVIETGAGALVIRNRIRESMERSATGAFRWAGSSGGSYLATYWSLVSNRRLRLPGWRLVVSDAEDHVFAPMADFTRSFPLVLAVSLLAVLAFGLSQIRRSLVPLEALHQGTQRIAQQDFESRVTISSRDEIEELATSFNAMAAQLGRQFSALSTAAEIDRAVLSSVDPTRIVETALTRLPELTPCDGIGLTLLDSRDNLSAVAWVADGPGTARRIPDPVTLTPSDLELLRIQRDRLCFSKKSPLVPTFLAPFAWTGPGRIEVLPLRFGEDLYGALALRWNDSGETESPDLLQIRRLADQVAVALGNARMVEQVKFMAFYDSLTGLPNRVLYKDRLGRALRRAERLRRHVAVCFLDLDRFSSINDTLGHDLGDRLIQDVAGRLQTCCRETDTVARVEGQDGGLEIARLGGDEFTVVLPDLIDPQDASRVARRLLACFAQPFRLGTHEVFVSTSIGIAIFPEDGPDSEELLKNADVAMYHAKEQGRNTWRMYSASMNAEAVARLRLEQELRRAVEAGQFSIVYQPIADLETGMVTGAEALVRWNHPERGLVSPGEFIALSEESGLIVGLGEWILRTVCAQGRAWEVAGLGRLRLSVNISARQLQHRDIVGTVGEILKETGLEPRLLVLELTESVLMQPEGQVANAIRALADLGVQFAIDDFGTGYSSLSYLKHFPVTALKIDRSFVHSVVSDSDDAAITSAIIALAQALEMEVIAEGVETADQAAFLGRQGCHKIQGYLVGTPVAPDEFQAKLRARSALPVQVRDPSARPPRRVGGTRRP